MGDVIKPLEMYRMPWSLTDNVISWLEPTAQCNLACDGCYRRNRVEHKTFEQTQLDLDVFQKHRRSDALSIAGGDPLLYPDLVRTVVEAKKRGYKPVVNTNGHALTPELVKELKQAGLEAFTFHVDSKQGRAGKWRGKSELELCDLRDELIELVRPAGIGVGFNMTVYPDTLEHVPKLTRWAEERIDSVSTMVFILYRDMASSRFRFFNGAKEVKMASAPRTNKQQKEVVYNLDVEKSYDDLLIADHVVSALKREFPDFEPSAYLNGTQDPSSVKWLLAGRIGRRGRVFGYAGPKFMELIQVTHHLFTDRYLAYPPKSMARSGRSALLLAPIDRGLRRTAVRFLGDALRAPWKALARPLWFQTIMIIQPIDVLADGSTNMCDGCPDMTVWNGRLVWSCRLDEQERYGRNLTAVPADDATAEAS